MSAQSSRRLHRPGPKYCALGAMLALSACSVPNHMHVTQGVSPSLADTNVRFRNKYYFRTFDYCWAASADGSQYRKIIPETDVLHRYLMTGKASALANKIQFESAVVDAAQLDPFGANLGIYSRKDDDQQSGPAVSIGTPDPAPKIATSSQTTTETTTVRTDVATATSNVTKETNTRIETADDCITSLQRRRGFMIMGPQGMVPFDQGKRLVLAMTSSADPLIATLQEYSGRVIAANANPTGQLIPLVNENKRARAAQDALRSVPPGATIDQIAQSALDAFTPKSETAP